MWVAMVACVTHSYCLSSLGGFLDVPTGLKTKSPVLLLLVFVRLFFGCIFVLDVDFSFSEILNLLSFLAALGFKPDFAVWEDVHPHGSRHILCPGGVFMWTVVGPLGFLLNSFSQSSISEL